MPSAYWFIRTNTTADPALPPVAANQALFNRDVSYTLSALAGGYGNAGDLLLRATPKAVANFVLCDGSELARLGFPDLFDAIGTEWGAGDGATTFNLPTQAQLWGFAATPATPPPQTVEGGAVSSGTTPTQPSGGGQTGGTSGGSVDSGGRARRNPYEAIP